MLQLSAMQVIHKQKPLSPKERKKLKAKEARERNETKRRAKIHGKLDFHKKTQYRNWEILEQQDFYETQDIPTLLEQALRQKSPPEIKEKYKQLLVITNRKRIDNFLKNCPYETKGRRINIDRLADKAKYALKNTKVLINEKQKQITDFDSLAQFTLLMQDAISFEIASRLKDQNPELTSLILSEFEKISEPFTEGAKPRLSKEFKDVVQKITSGETETSNVDLLNIIANKNVEFFRNSRNTKNSIQRLDKLQQFFQKHPELGIQKNGSTGQLLELYRSLLKHYENFKRFISVEFRWLNDSDQVRRKNQQLRKIKRKCPEETKLTNPKVYYKKHLQDLLLNDMDNIKKNQEYFYEVVAAAIDLYNPHLDKELLLNKVHKALELEVDIRKVSQNSNIDEKIKLRENFKNPIVAEIQDYLDKHHEPKESPLRSLFKNWDKFIKAEYGALFII